MNQRQELQRGIDATAVLENAAYQEAMTLLKASVVEQWKGCSISDREKQVLFLQMARLADTFEGLLAGLVERGKLAKRKIEIDDARDESQARRFFRRVV